MDQLKKLFASLSLRQRVTIGLVAAGVVAAVFGLTQWQHERDYKPLYTALAPEDAGVVIQKLRESNVDYRLGENGSSVLVPESKVAELRLELASAGLPKSGRIGFELFDKTNFGMTEFTEHVNFRRALEGELERSVMSLAEVEQARVHLTFPKESVFIESRQSAKASVLVKLRPGAKIAPQSVAAITHLVASAVEGLMPEAVSVLDMRGAVLSRPRSRAAADGSADSEATLEYQQKIEKELSNKIGATLEPLLGADKFRAAVSVECDLTSGEQSEETFDPTKSVMATSQKTEDRQSTASAGGLAGTASNLPRPPEKAAAPADGFAHRTEQITYQTSRTTRHTKLPQGAVKHVSVAVLLDQAIRWEGSGAKARKVLVAPSPETVKTIHDLVAAAIGFSPQRGDLLTIESLPFESTMSLQPPEQSNPAPAPVPESQLLLEKLKKDPRTMMVFGAGLLVLLVMVAGGVWLLKKRGAKRFSAVSAPALPDAPLAPGAPSRVDQEDVLGRIAGLAAQGGQPALDLQKFPAIAASRAEVFATQLRAGAVKDAELYAGVLRGWIGQEGGN